MGFWSFCGFQQGHNLSAGNVAATAAQAFVVPLRCHLADQPAVYPHETVAAWIRCYQRRHPVPKHDDLDVMETSFVNNCNQCMQWINSKYDLEGVHRKFPERIQEGLDSEGERLPH